jgi:hypothetical protein
MGSGGGRDQPVAEAGRPRAAQVDRARDRARARGRGRAGARGGRRPAGRRLRAPPRRAGAPTPSARARGARVPPCASMHLCVHVRPRAWCTPAPSRRLRPDCEARRLRHTSPIPPRARRPIPAGLTPESAARGLPGTSRAASASARCTGGRRRGRRWRARRRPPSAAGCVAGTVTTRSHLH